MIKTISGYQAFSRGFRAFLIVAFILFMVIKLTCWAHVDLIELPNSHHESIERQYEEKEARERRERVERGNATDRDREQNYARERERSA